MSLKGKTILVTRRHEQSAEIVAEIEKRGGRAVVIPMIAISDPESWVECDMALDSISSYHGIIFTSANAATKWFRRAEDRCVSLVGLSTLEIIAVGERTKQEIEKHGMNVAYLPEKYSSEALAQHFQKDSASGKRFLFPKGNLGKTEIADTLTKLGATVDVIEIYTNSEPFGSAGDELRKGFLHRQFDVVTFASPSAVRNFAREISPILFRHSKNKMKIAVIGPSTKQAAIECGYPADIEAEESTSTGLIESIDNYYSRQQQ